MCACLEWSHACAEGWRPVRWRDSYVQIVSDLEALRLQRHGVICTLPAGHSTANVFQPEAGEDDMFYTTHTNSTALLASGLVP